MNHVLVSILLVLWIPTFFIGLIPIQRIINKTQKFEDWLRTPLMDNKRYPIFFIYLIIMGALFITLVLTFLK